MQNRVAKDVLLLIPTTRASLLSHTSLMSSFTIQVSWIYLPASWKLEDVQAALNVIISVLSGLGIFVFARLCWVRAAADIAQDQSIKLSSLTTLNTIGESFDVLQLLRCKILSSTYLYHDYRSRD